MTQSEFIKFWCDGKITEEEVNNSGQFAVPCDCHAENCYGWRMVYVNELKEMMEKGTINSPQIIIKETNMENENLSVPPVDETVLDPETVVAETPTDEEIVQEVQPVVGEEAVE